MGRSPIPRGFTWNDLDALLCGILDRHPVALAAWKSRSPGQRDYLANLYLFLYLEHWLGRMDLAKYCEEKKFLWYVSLILSPKECKEQLDSLLLHLKTKVRELGAHSEA